MLPGNRIKNIFFKYSDIYSNIFINVCIFPFLLSSSHFHLIIKQSVFFPPPSKKTISFHFLPSPRYIACQHWIPNKHTSFPTFIPFSNLFLRLFFFRKRCIQTATFTINSSIFLFITQDEHNHLHHNHHPFLFSRWED